MDGFEGKVAVVTGAASGIGRALAERFAREGMRVVLADVEREPLEVAAKAIADRHGDDRVLAVPTDVRDEHAVDALAAATFDRFGGAHVVCNNAGVGVGGLAWTIPADRWRWIVEVNLLSVAHGIRAFVPRMIEQGEGHVVNTASAAGILTGPAMGPYYATKHGGGGAVRVAALRPPARRGDRGRGVGAVPRVGAHPHPRLRAQPTRRRGRDARRRPGRHRRAPGMRDFVQGLVDGGPRPGRCRRHGGRRHPHRPVLDHHPPNHGAGAPSGGGTPSPPTAARRCGT